jgi:Superinfection immunity protein
MGSTAVVRDRTDPRQAAVLGVVMVSVLALLGATRGAGAVEVAILGALGLLVFLAPSIIASARKVSHQGVIGVLNVVFGVTLVGWVVALALALARSPRRLAIGSNDGDDSALTPPRRDALDELGQRIVGVIGLPGARELRDVLTHSPENMAALIGRLYSRADATWLAQVLTETEVDPDDLARLQLIESLHRVVG